MSNSFTYNIQQAGYKFDQYDEKGEAGFEAFIDEFRAYPWSAQAGKSNGGSEATISVQNHSNGIDLWVSVIGKPSEYAHLVGIVYEKDKKRFLGFGKPKKVSWVKIHIAEKPEEVENSFHLFFNSETSKFFKFLQTLPLLHEQEAAKY